MPLTFAGVIGEIIQLKVTPVPVVPVLVKLTRLFLQIVPDGDCVKVAVGPIGGLVKL